MLERWVYFALTRVHYRQFTGDLVNAFNDGDLEQAKALCERNRGIEERVVAVGLDDPNTNAQVLQGNLEGFVLAEKHKLDRGLVILGTLGNNAPFIGLFGTVIGIIKAFNDLSLNPEGGPSVVMAGISEALVATAVGLLVAIPAVIAFNIFNRIVKRRINNTHAIIQLIVAHSQNNKVGS